MFLFTDYPAIIVLVKEVPLPAFSTTTTTPERRRSSTRRLSGPWKAVRRRLTRTTSSPSYARMFKSTWAPRCPRELCLEEHQLGEHCLGGCCLGEHFLEEHCPGDHRPKKHQSHPPASAHTVTRTSYSISLLRSALQMLHRRQTRQTMNMKPTRDQLLAFRPLR